MSTAAFSLADSSVTQALLASGTVPFFNFSMRKTHKKMTRWTREDPDLKPKLANIRKETEPVIKTKELSVRLDSCSP